MAFNIYRFRSKGVFFFFFFEEIVILIRTQGHESSIYSFLNKLIIYYITRVPLQKDILRTFINISFKEDFNTTFIGNIKKVKNKNKNKNKKCP